MTDQTTSIELENARCCYWCGNKYWAETLGAQKELFCGLDHNPVPPTAYCGNWEEWSETDG